MIKIPNPSQEPPASSKPLNEDLKDIDVLFTFKIKIESQNSDHWSCKDKWTSEYQNKKDAAIKEVEKLQGGMDQPIQIMIKIPNPSQ